MLPPKLAISICCHFKEERLQYLEKMSSQFAKLASEVLVIIVSNTNKPEELSQFDAVLRHKGFEYRFFTPDTLGHPLLLTWAHFPVFKELLADESFSHFMYLEDDTLITPVNMSYWMEAREDLRPYGLIPSFLRVENKAHDSTWYSSDCPHPFFVYGLPRVKVSLRLGFINFPELYQGMYLLDRELMIEHLHGQSYNPNFGRWGIQEKAAQGVTFLNVPKGFTTRNVIPYDLISYQIDERCFIHHLPNNYAQPMDGHKIIKTMPVQKLLSPWPNKVFLRPKNLKKFFKAIIK